jgi:2-methylfumaryl-CoA hydratase
MTSRATGYFFEDFAVGRELRHATPRTVTTGDAALYLALTGSRFAQQSSDPFARANGLPRAPVDDLLAFHIVFGRTVPDVSLNAIANLGYAECIFASPVFPGDTLVAASRIVGVRETSNRKAGVVWVRTTGTNQDGRPVVDYVRWVMVRKRDPQSPSPEPAVPDLAKQVTPGQLVVPDGLHGRGFDAALAGSPRLFGDYAVGERIDHVDGMTIEEAEHRMATRLYQNTARVHFNSHTERDGRFGRCIIYGGHVISVARALSFNGLENVLRIAAINGGRHVNPCFAGDTVYAWSEILDTAALPGHDDLGALRIRLVATRDRPCGDFPLEDAEGKDDPAVLLDLDYWAIVPRAV